MRRLVVAVGTLVVAAVGDSEIDLVGRVHWRAEQISARQLWQGAGWAVVARIGHGCHQLVDTGQVGIKLRALAIGTLHLAASALLRQAFQRQVRNSCGRGVEVDYVGDVAEEHAGAIRIDTQMHASLAAVEIDAIGMETRG